LFAITERQAAMTEARAQEAEQTGHAEFEAFYARTARTLHGYLCWLSGDSATADEVLQETYIRMLNAPPMWTICRAKAISIRLQPTCCEIAGAS